MLITSLRAFTLRCRRRRSQAGQWSIPCCAVLVVVLGPAPEVRAQDRTTRILAESPETVEPAPATTATRTSVEPTVDGRLDDAAWSRAPVVDQFTQRDPDEGQAASEGTEVRIVYDDQALYVGARLHDRSPVTSRLGRRDMERSSSDWLRISLDSFYDRRTAYRFEVNPSGVRRDAVLRTGGNRGRGGGGGGVGGPEGDLAWDGVWDAAATVDEAGWVAEMRIPFSQLRFAPAEEQSWGLQIERILHRRQEWSQFSFTPKSEPGGIPAYGQLRRLQDLQPGRPLELIPYVLGESHLSRASANPTLEQRDVVGNVGLDLRYRVTSNLTLSATANPDFGQVEVDPAVINLTAFETRFEEKRPFFVEGASMFEFGGAVFGPPRQTAGSLLYTRRMGRSPQMDIDGDEVDSPPVTTILGAAKLSGKTPGGWSIGVLNVVTGQETARVVDRLGTRQEALAEPRTNYFAGRVTRELREGQTVFGALLTSVERDQSADAAAASLRASAYTGGVDFQHEFANRSWIVTGFLAGSRVGGSADAIQTTQESSTRYFQRPDASHVSLDSTRTSLAGSAATIQLRKTAGVHWRSDTWLQMITPGFEINDIGFLQRADRRGLGQSVWYWERTPGRVLREWRLINSVAYVQNFGGNVVDHQYRSQLQLTHLNYWELELSGQYEPQRLDDRFTRGGPLQSRPATWQYSVSLQSDPRRPVFGQIEGQFTADRAGGYERALDALVNVRTSPRWNLSVGPNLKEAFVDAQYVDEVTDAAMTATYGRRYIFAPLKQTELSLVTRLNYTFTPDLSLEVYLQPLIADGRYGALEEFQQPRGYEFLTYGRDIGTVQRIGDDFLVDPDGDGAGKAFVVPDETFTTRSLRGNAVLRWEYRPGSTLFVVWQQDRLNEDLMEPFAMSRALGSLLGSRSNNTLVVKWTYWLNP